MKNLDERNLLIEQFENYLLSINRVALRKLMEESSMMDDPIRFVDEIIVPVMERFGEGWEQGHFALSQIYMGSRICEEMVDQILPPEAPERTDQLNMAICVLEDHHFLGKRIVYTSLRASGFELQDYGGVTVDELIKKIKEDDIKIILVSTLMLPSALMIKVLKDKLNALNRDVTLVVGGAPFRFDTELGQEVGADFVGKNASDTIRIIKKIMEGNS